MHKKHISNKITSSIYSNIYVRIQVHIYRAGTYNLIFTSTYKVDGVAIQFLQYYKKIYLNFL